MPQIVPSDELHVSWSEIDAYRHCPFKWMLSYEQRWQKVPAPMSPLDKGTAWHLVMEAHYKTILNHQAVGEGGRIEWRDKGKKISARTLTDKCIDAVEAELFRQERTGGTPELITLLKWMYRGHLEMYGLDEEYDIVSVESTHLVPLGRIPYGRSSTGTIKVIFKFKVDSLVRDKYGQLRVKDEKSCSNLPTNAELDMIDQFPLYQKGFRLLDIDVRGGIHSASRANMNQGDIFKPGDEGYKKSMKAQSLEDRFRRTPLHYTPAQLNTVWSEALATVRQMYGPANERERHPDAELCRRKCSYLEACLFGRRTGKVSDTVNMLDRIGFTQEYERH